MFNLDLFLYNFKLCPLVLELVFKVNRSSEEMLMRPFKILYVKIKSPRNCLAYGDAESLAFLRKGD